jgi:hypothetical protein
MTDLIPSTTAPLALDRATDYAEQLATEIRADFVEQGGALAWIEHYPPRRSVFDRETPIGEGYDRVLMRWTGTEYTDPKWEPISRSQVEALIGEPLGD